MQKQWSKLENILAMSLPGVPSPQVLGIAGNSGRLTFEHAGSLYLIPRATDQIFRPAQEPNLSRFVRVFVESHKNKSAPIGKEVIKKALKQFASRGFPKATGLCRKFSKMVGRDSQLVFDDASCTKRYTHRSMRVSV